jgi:hypothetical protein
MNCYIFASGTDSRPDRTNLTRLNASREAARGKLLLMNCYIFASGTDTRPDRTNLTSENASCSGSPAASAHNAAMAMPPALRSQTALPAGGASPAVALYTNKYSPSPTKPPTFVVACVEINQCVACTPASPRHRAGVEDDANAP